MHWEISLPLHKKCPYSVLFWFAFFSHFPAFGLNTERYYSVRMRENAGKMRTRITPNTDTFYAVYSKNWLAEKRNCSNEGQVIKAKQFKQIDNEHRGETKQKVQLVNKDVTPAGFWCLLKNRMKVSPRHRCNAPQANRAYY